MSQKPATPPAQRRDRLALGLIIVLPFLLLAPHVLRLLLPAQWRGAAQVMAYISMCTCVVIVLIYAARHYGFTLNRLFARQRHLYLDLDTQQWPPITVLVMAHNEEQVIEGSLRALLSSDYPADRVTIMPVNDRSTDNTAALINALAARHPGRIAPLHRVDGEGGKPAALEWACRQVDTDIIVVFDADYLPGKGLLKQLVSPFFDPEVGATMGRVIPLNARSNLLTQTLSLERCAGYQVNQQARENMRLTAQYGGTVGAVRKTALRQVGGWSTDCLAEDTDITFRLRLSGWKVVYQNRAECYEEVPEEWPVRIRQLTRWTSGHHQVLLRHWLQVVSTERLSVKERFDAVLLLTIFMLAPVILIGWSSGVFLFFDDPSLLGQGSLWVLILIAYSGFGNFATFTETAAGAFLDRSRGSLVLMPFMAINFMIGTVEISRAILLQSWKALTQQRSEWNKTVRYRQTQADVTTLPPPPHKPTPPHNPTPERSA